MRPRGTGNIYHQRQSRYWWIRYYRNGVRYSESARTTDKREAQRLLQRRLSEIASGQFYGPVAERVKVSELAEDFLRDYRINKRKSLDRAEQLWAKHLRPFLGNLRAVQVTTDIINRYIELRQRAGAQNATINRELSALRRMFSLAYRSTPRKVYQVPTISNLRENPPRKGFVEEGQYRELCKYCKELWLRALLAVAYTFGFRKGELLGLRVRQVDLLNRIITLDPGTTKNNQARTVKMTEEVYQLVKECVRGKHGEDYVFTRGNGDRVKDFRGAWARICKQAGVTGLLLHDLRRSAVRNMVRSGVSEAVAMRISGHKTRAVFERYNIVSEADLAEAARKIEQHTLHGGHDRGHLANTDSRTPLAPHDKGYSNGYSEPNENPDDDEPPVV